MRIILYFITLGLITTSLNAQLKVKVTSDLGWTTASEGLNWKSALSGSYNYAGFELSSGIQKDIIGYQYSLISGWNLALSKELSIRNFNFEASLFYMWTPYTDLVNEKNYGIIFSKVTNHFYVNLGTNVKETAYSQKAIKMFDIHKDLVVYDMFNILYRIGYNLKSSENKWNLGIALTDYDDYYINQDANPYWFLHAYYDINMPVRIFGEIWYKTAGAFNLHINEYGYLLKSGVIWQLK